MSAKILRVGLCILIALSLASCSRSLGYRFADTFILWQLDKYVTLERSDRDRVRAQIDAWLQWHAENELPRYYLLLGELQYYLENDSIDESVLRSYAETTEMLWDNIRQALYPELKTELMRLSDAQVNELIANIQENIEKRRNEHSEKSAVQRHEERVERFQSIFQRVAGRMSPLQLRWVEELSYDTPDLNPAWLEYREVWLEAFAYALTHRDNPEVFDTYLTPVILAPEQMRSDVLVQQTEQNQARSIETLERLAGSLTEQQKRRSLRRLERFKRDLNAMMRQRDVDFTPP